jgi:2-oxoisovalerate dehydrogenase E1 component
MGNKNLNNYIEKSIFIREFESILLELFNKGRLNGTVHTCVGQEVTPVVLNEFLTPDDKIFSNHRGHGHFLAMGGNYKELLSELLGKENGTSSGIGGSQHLFNDRFISNGIQGGLAPAAVGYSFINKLKKTKNISVAFIGDGTLGSGALYESFNLASVFNSPTLFILENNRYAQSTSFKDSFSGSTKDRAKGFGLEFFSADIWDIEDLEAQLEKSVQHVREGKPALIEIDCYRLNSHSKGDDNRFESEIQEYEEKDVLNQFKAQFPAEWEKLVKLARNSLEDALLECESSNFLESMNEYTYINSQPVETQKLKSDVTNESSRINKSIYEGLKNLLSDNQTIFIGEDIKNTTKNTERPYGGAFKVSNDLSDLFPDKVLNSPISEAAMIGFGIGAALNGHRSIVEIMFGDFLTLGFDQILQQASKIPAMYGKSIDLPLIIRTPMGGRRGYGPTHSQSIEKHFMFIPNIDMIALNSYVKPSDVYASIGSEIKNTTIVIEDKIGYTKFHNHNTPKGYELKSTKESFPTLIFTPTFTKPNCIIFLYGGMLDELLSGMGELLKMELFPQIICPTKIVPLNIFPLIEGLKTSKKLIFIEEGSKFGGLSSEIITFLSENDHDFKLLTRISNESLIPCSKLAELSVVPNSSLIVKKLKKLSI